MDVSQFIELVREQPCLYDSKDPMSKNKKVKEKKWTEIAAAMKITTNVKISDTEVETAVSAFIVLNNRQCVDGIKALAPIPLIKPTLNGQSLMLTAILDQCKFPELHIGIGDLARSKWKNLKDNYNKHLKSTAADGGYCLKYLHWPWASNMEFMKKHLTCISSTTIDDHQNRQIYESGHLDSESSTRSDDRSEDMDNTARLQSNMAREDQLKTTPKVFHYIDKEQDDGYDAMDLIFLGYAKTIKEFSVRRQAQIKLKLAKVIMEEELAHYEEISIYPQNPMYYSNPPSPQNDPLNSKLTLVKTEEF